MFHVGGERVGMCDSQGGGNKRRRLVVDVFFSAIAPRRTIVAKPAANARFEILDDSSAALSGTSNG